MSNNEIAEEQEIAAEHRKDIARKNEAIVEEEIEKSEKENPSSGSVPATERSTESDNKSKTNGYGEDNYEQ